MTLQNMAVVIAAGIMLILVNLDLTIVNLAIATITQALDIKLVSAQWILVSYSLASVASFALAGRLSDRYGRKAVFLVGVVLFSAASLVIGLANNIYLVCIFRFIQGIGFAATLSNALTLIALSFPENKRGFAYGIGLTFVGGAQAVGPSIGGILISYTSWRWIFLMNVPLGILSLVIGCIYMKRQSDDAYSKHPLSVTSVFLFVCSIMLIISALNEFANISLPLFFSWFSLGVVMFAAYIIKSFTAPYPLVDLSLLKHKGFMSVVVIRFVIMYFMVTFLFIVPLLMQNIFNFSALKTGYYLLIMGVFVAVLSPVTGKLIDDCGAKIFILLSSVFALFTSLGFVFISEHLSLVTLMILLVGYGLAVGFNLTASVAAVDAQVPKRLSNIALGVFFTVALAGVSLGVAASGAILSFFSRRYVAASNLVMSSEQRDAFLQVANGAHSYQWFVQQSKISLPSSYEEISKQAFFCGLHNVGLVLIVLAFIACFLSYRLKDSHYAG
jgi:EmrB/QacA subfamily drug resistance transporter